MASLVEASMMLLILTDMALLGLSRLRPIIAASAFQGMLLGAFTIFAHVQDLAPRIVVIGLASFALKGFVFPWLLRRSIREADVHTELEPYVGFSLSILAGILMLGVSVWLSGQLPLEAPAGRNVAIPAALTTFFTGLFLIVARKKALTQCLGYIIMENGIYVIGIMSVVHVPALVELGILVDVSVAVLVMGVAIFYINRQFDHIDTDQLDSLKG